MNKQQNLEEIVMVVENVKHKKVEGALYLMNERIAWMPKQKNFFTVSHHYADIKTQKISTEGKAKIQLQVVLHDDTSSTFHFISPSGQQQQLKDRDQVKDQLAKLLPAFKQKISQELEEKKRILIENPQVYQLYNDLVVGQLVSAEEFWKNYINFNEYKQESKNQPTGVSQGFMSNICPKSDGTNGLVYNITTDDIESIFKTYPEVKNKFVQNVPIKLTEKEFWTKFFQSYYFRRDQINTTANDLFADCAFKEDDEIKKKAELTLTEPVQIVDSQKDLSNEDGFGLTDFLANKPINVSNQNLIKRYNFYSMRVLNSMEEASKDSKSQQNEESYQASKKIRLDEDLEDLHEDNPLELKGAQLNLTHTDRYFHGLKSNDTKSADIDVLLKAHNPSFLFQNIINEVSGWSMNVNNIDNPSMAIAILIDLSPGSQLMLTNGIQNLKDEIPKINQEEIKALYVSSCEMLRHFWACFPPKNLQLETKLKAMVETLECFYNQKILTLREHLIKENFSWNLTMHLEAMFKIAFTKYKKYKNTFI